MAVLHNDHAALFSKLGPERELAEILVDFVVMIEKRLSVSFDDWPQLGKSFGVWHVRASRSLDRFCESIASRGWRIARGKLAGGLECILEAALCGWGWPL